MKILIYVGANRGYGLYRLLQNRPFDIIYAFEPDPEIFQELRLSGFPYPVEKTKEHYIGIIDSHCNADTCKKEDNSFQAEPVLGSTVVKADT
jgi:hypothetical protein